MQKLSKLEQDFLGDISQDAHELWELYGFVKLHHPESQPEEVIRLGRELLESWVARGWLSAQKSRSNAVIMTGEQLISAVTSLGSVAHDPEKAVILLTLTEQASKDVKWLKPHKLDGSER